MPQLPKHSPVIALHLRADVDVNGNPRRAFVVLDAKGRHVETIDEGYYGDAALYSRYPWFHHSVAGRLGLESAYAVPMDVAPKEYRRWLKREPYEQTAALRERADRYAARYEDLGVLRH